MIAEPGAAHKSRANMHAKILQATKKALPIRAGKAYGNSAIEVNVPATASEP
jgi:hypothetical protein